MNLILSNPVDNAIAANHDLSDVLDSQFGNNPPEAWVACQSVCGEEYPVGEYCRQRWSVAGNEKTDRLEIIGPPAASTLLEPFRHTLADLFLTQEFTAIRLA